MNKQNLPTRTQIFEYWKSRTKEPEEYLTSHCWVCGKRVRNVDQLERHHIIPESLGGSVDPENLYLLCKKCHDAAPSANDRGLFFSWAEDRAEINEVYREAAEALKTIDAGEDFAKWLNAKTKEETQALLKGKLTINYTAYGPMVPAVGPLAVLKKEYEKEEQNDRNQNT